MCGGTSRASRPSIDQQQACRPTDARRYFEVPEGSWNVFMFENNYMLEHGSNSASFDMNNEWL